MLYGVAGGHSFLMAGKAGSVSADQDCIRIKAAEPGRLILKYHYFKTLRTDPPITMSPAPIGNGDPVPFIAIDNDSRRDIRVYNVGFGGWGSAAVACHYAVGGVRLTLAGGYFTPADGGDRSPLRVARFAGLRYRDCGERNRCTDFPTNLAQRVPLLANSRILLVQWQALLVSGSKSTPVVEFKML